VYATRRFAADETIGRIWGDVVADPEYGSDYCIGMTDEVSLEPHAPFRYLNHCCQPNCTLAVVDADQSESGEPEVWLESLRAIQSGEQLTIDYAWPADAAIRCLCGSDACRGWVVAEEELGKLARRAARSPRPRRPRSVSVQ
jgi:hypothetical protein